VRFVALVVCGAVLLAACGPREAEPPASDTPVSTPGSVMDTASAGFLSLFEPPRDTVRLRGAVALRLWDRMVVAEAPDFDPLREMNAGATAWEQIEGEPVRLEKASSLDATAHIPAPRAPARYVFRLTMRNASGERTVLVPVLVLP
jgi:hypothetical protein